MRLIVQQVEPFTVYQGRIVNYRVHACTESGRTLCCLVPSGASAQFREGDRVSGLLTALSFEFTEDRPGPNRLTGRVRRVLPLDANPAYRGLMENHFLCLDTPDGLLFLSPCRGRQGPLVPDGRQVSVHITGGLYFEPAVSVALAL